MLTNFYRFTKFIKFKKINFIIIKSFSRTKTSFLNLINLNNANHSCITAAAGTCIGHDYKKEISL